MIFQADVLRQPLSEVLATEGMRAVHEPERRASWLYAEQIVQGVLAHQEEIDEKITSSANGWTLDRMPHVDRAILRVAAWEILFNEEVPTPVAIDEAVDLAKELSTEDSGKFVNGVLGRIALLAEL